MDNTTRPWPVRPGATMYFADGDPVGTVLMAHTTYLVVTKGIFFPLDYAVPTSAIATVAGGAVYLGVTKDEARNSGWYEQPVDPAWCTTAPPADVTDRTTGTNGSR